MAQPCVKAKLMKYALIASAITALTIPVIAQNISHRIPLFKTGAVRVLILSGENNHDWRTTTPCLRRLLENTGRFDVRVNEEPTGMTAATLAVYDVLVLDYNGPRWGPTAEAALADFVRSGKGLVAVHGANWAFSGLVVLAAHHVPTGITEPPWPEYKKMIGGVWSDQPPASGHAPRHRFLVNIIDREHPITKGLPASFEADDELYHNIHMEPNVHVLATAFDDPKFAGHTPPPAPSKGWPHLDMMPTGKNEPMLWTVHYGRGRTFYTALGHDVKAEEMPGFSTTFVRGVEWAATGAVKSPAPPFRSWVEPLPPHN